MRNWTSDWRIPRSDALPLSHRDSTVSEVYYEVHITRVLPTARISNVDGVMFVIRIREMVSFELCQEIKKDFFRVPRSWQDEKHLSLFIYRTQNLPSLLVYILLTFWNLAGKKTGKRSSEIWIAGTKLRNGDHQNHRVILIWSLSRIRPRDCFFLPPWTTRSDLKRNFSRRKCEELIFRSCKCASYVSRMFVIFEVLHNLDFKHDTIPGGLFFSVTISFILPSSSPTQSRG